MAGTQQQQQQQLIVVLLLLLLKQVTAGHQLSLYIRSLLAMWVTVLPTVLLSMVGTVLAVTW
jgi:hypothetical protein